MAAPVYTVGRLYNTETNLFVPIFSLDSIRLSRSNDWQTMTSISSLLNMQWKGATPLMYNVDFELLVGSSHYIQTRQDLYDYVRIYHSMAAHQMRGDITLPPPPVRLIISSYINMIGVMADIETDAGPPWGKFANLEMGDSLLPSKCKFTGRFIAVPGYQGGGEILVSGNNKALSHDQVRTKLYYE